MNIFDSTIIHFVNKFSHHSVMVDGTISLICHNHLLKGGVILAIVWWLWFKKSEFQPKHHAHIIATFIGCIVGMALARFLALTLPFRLRPIHEEGLNFTLPYGLSPDTLDGWSSFPSDHAVLFFGLSAGLFFISRKAGAFAIIYTTLFIAFPRIYLGLHYPTDIIAGAVVGISIVVLSNILLVKSKSLESITNWSHSNPSFFYSLFFLFSFQIADMFDSSRALMGAGVKLFSNILA
jgi:undecaprenyl-diphosphatase